MEPDHKHSEAREILDSLTREASELGLDEVDGDAYRGALAETRSEEPKN